LFVVSGYSSRLDDCNSIRGIYLASKALDKPLKKMRWLRVARAL